MNSGLVNLNNILDPPKGNNNNNNQNKQFRNNDSNLWDF